MEEGKIADGRGPSFSLELDFFLRTQFGAKLPGISPFPFFPFKFLSTGPHIS